MRVCIFGAGDYHGEGASLCEGAFVIAADGGYRYATEAGFTPSLAIGDFDSLGEIPHNIPVKQYPVEKDDTDMALAVKEAIAMGADEIVMLASLGGRLDHTLANITLLHALAKEGIAAYLVGRGECLTVLHTGETLSFEAVDEGILSLFSLSDEATVTIEGLQYPLDRGVLTRERALGVSNHFIGQAARVTLHRGELLFVWDRVDAPFPTRERTDKV